MLVRRLMSGELSLKLKIRRRLEIATEETKHVNPDITTSGSPEDVQVAAEDDNIQGENGIVGLSSIDPAHTLCGTSLSQPTVLQFRKTRKLSVNRADPTNRQLLQKRQFFHSHRAQLCFCDAVMPPKKGKRGRPARNTNDAANNETANNQDLSPVAIVAAIQEMQREMTTLRQAIPNASASAAATTTTATVDAADWLTYVEDKMEVFEVVYGDRVRYGTQLLKGEAQTWWRGVQRANSHAPGTLTWHVFVRQFERRFYPTTFLEKMKIDLQSYKQEKKTVAEYEVGFNKIVHFVPHVANNELERAAQFRQGLRPSIRHTLGAFPLLDFRTTVEQALGVEMQHQYTHEMKPSGSDQPRSQDDKKGVVMCTIERTVSGVVLVLFAARIIRTLVLADRHVPWACEAFSRFHGKQLVQNPPLLWSWCFFMIKLWNHGLLDARTMNTCNIILQGIQDEGSDPKQP
ncbi:hypothetical protein PR202_gn00402 [Eleusine coracana subsp. coracana]|uniref:Retrotransposon gag domain-containing protein n=1 Tax=Eleusine coracana subsp. coracana TaxID=191504 RepID=A0AAV5G2R5_ELECO|nr:hypothetical protein PR202_gn00402 [Eleusine coracana subsp. coracana]